MTENYKLVKVENNQCLVVLKDGQNCTFISSANSLEVLKEILSDSDYSRVKNAWSNNIIEITIPEKVLKKMKDNKIDEMDEICHNTIVSGFDAVMSDGKTYHFSLEVEDQLMIQALMLKVKSGQTTLLRYHADDQTCRYFSTEEIMLLYNNMEQIITYNTTYFNSLRDYINSLDDDYKLSKITWGTEIPEEYQSEVLKDLLVNKEKG